jgi:hypothetical protein
MSADLARVMICQARRLLLTQCHIPIYKHDIRNDGESSAMSDEIVPRPPARWRGRRFQPGQSGNPAGRRRASRNKATLAAAALLDGEALGLTRRAVEAALAGDMLAMKLCLERVLPRCQERPVAFSLPSLAAVGNGDIDEPSPQNVARAMNAVTTALACGEITPGEAATIAGVYETFVRTAGVAREKVAGGSLLQILTAAADVEDEDEDIGDGEAIDDCDP